MGLDRCSNSLPSFPRQYRQPFTSHGRRGCGAGAISRNFSVKEVEIEKDSPLIVAEEPAVLRVSNIGVHIQWVEMVGDVQQGHRKPDRMFLGNLNVLRHHQVEGEVAREPGLRARSSRKILLQHIRRLIWEPVPVFDMRV